MQMQDDMAEATRLTRNGRLAEATALIQRTLGRSAGGPVDSGAPPSPPWATLPEGAPPPAAEAAARPGSAAARSGSAGARSGSAAARPGSAGARSGSGGRFLDASFTNAAGTRGYKLYVPGGYGGRAVPLVVMLHGCTQTAADFAAGTRMNQLAERDTFLVAYPEQAGANQRRCWNWFLPAHQRRDAGEPSLLAGITRQVMAAYKVDPGRVFVAGLSAGGAMAAVLAATYPDLFTAAGIHSGLAYGAARDVSSAYAAMRDGPPAGGPAAGGGSVPVIVFQGDRDTTVAPANAAALLSPWSQSARPEVVSGPGWTRRVYRDGDGHPTAEWWNVHRLGHAWSGGSPQGSFTDPAGPDASAELVRFFADVARRGEDRPRGLRAWLRRG